MQIMVKRSVGQLHADVNEETFFIVGDSIQWQDIGMRRNAVVDFNFTRYLLFTAISHFHCYLFTSHCCLVYWSIALANLIFKMNIFQIKQWDSIGLQRIYTRGVIDK